MFSRIQFNLFFVFHFYQFISQNPFQNRFQNSFMLHNTRRKRPSLSQKARQVLFQAIVSSRLGSLTPGWLCQCAFVPLRITQNATAPGHPALATDARFRPFLHPGHGQTMARTGPSTTLYDCQAACYSCSMTLPHQPPYQILIVCSPGSALEEGAPHWHQDGRAPTRLPPFRPLPGCVETYSTSCLQSEALAAV